MWHVKEHWLSHVGYKHISYEGCGWEACANDCKKKHKQIEFGNKKCWIASVDEGVHPGFEPGCSWPKHESFPIANERSIHMT